MLAGLPACGGAFDVCVDEYECVAFAWEVPYDVCVLFDSVAELPDYAACVDVFVVFAWEFG